MSELHPSAAHPKSDPDRLAALRGPLSTLTPPRAALSSQRSALNFLPRLRESLALRLAAQYALVFALSSGILFGVLYWTLAESLDARELAGETAEALAKKSSRLLQTTWREQREQGDPRATKLLDLAKEWGVAGEHVRAVEVLASQVEGVYGRPFPMNVSAAIPAVLLDAGYPAGALKGIPLLARTASLVAHILEEQTRPIGFKLASAAEQAMSYDGPDATR